MPALSPAELAEQPAAAALLQALKELGGEATPAELGERAELAPSTRSKWLKRLRNAGLVDGPQPRPHLTSEGWSQADVGLPAVMGAQLELGAAIARWPAEPQRAYLRLLLGAVVARWHLGRERAQHHPGFIAAGRTGTGKTSMARFVCHAFGLDAEAQIVYLGGRSAGEILGRRQGGAEGMRFEPSPLLAGPLIVFDEFDKAEREQQRAALLCFQGDTAATIEQTEVRLCAVPMLACNVQDGLPIPPEYRRRSIVLDMDAIAELLEDLDLVLYELEQAGGPPRLDLEQLRPPASRLPPDVFRAMREALRGALTEEGWTLCNAASIELLALGYAGGLDPAEVDLGAAAVQAARDYLTCAETVGETRPGWRSAMAHAVAGPVKELDAGEAELARVADARRERAAAQEREALERLGARQQLAEELRQAKPDARSLLPGNRAEGKGVAAQLERLREQVLESRSDERLAELGQVAGELLARARAVRGRDEQERSAAAASQQHARDAQRQQREQAAAARREQKASAVRQREEDRRRRREASTQLTAVRRQARPLETMWAREGGTGALDALRRTAVDGRALVTFERDKAAAGSGALERIFAGMAAASGMGTWRATFAPGVTFAGTQQECSALEAWGPGTRRVIAPVLQQLHAQEDHLLDVGGGKVRGRPRVS